MPSTPLTCCSIGAATVSETTWALAPGYLQLTVTEGGAIWGYWASGRLNMAMPPASVMTIDRTDAKIGRSMKNREIKADALRPGPRPRTPIAAPGAGGRRRPGPLVVRVRRSGGRFSLRPPGGAGGPG